jgi:Ca2+-binding EF-hand superfamily protein
MLKKLGVDASGVVAETIHQRIDKNNSGYIEFEEFKKFLYYDPYPY